MQGRGEGGEVVVEGRRGGGGEARRGGRERGGGWARVQGRGGYVRGQRRGRKISGDGEIGEGATEGEGKGTSGGRAGGPGLGVRDGG